jgi:hypothetical protein
MDFPQVSQANVKQDKLDDEQKQSISP